MILIPLLSLLTTVLSQTSDQSLYSKLGDVCETMCPNHVERASAVSRQAVPGKMGPIGTKGEMGLKGSKGEEGEVNYDKVEEIISRRIQEVLDIQERKHSNLSRLLLEANDDINTLKNETRLINRQVQNRTDYCPLKYEERCFWVVFNVGNQMTFEEGRQICSNQGGRPANIYSESHFYIMMGYLTTYKWRHGWVDVWLGMTYDSQAKAVSLTDGSRAPFLKWYPGYPGSNCCNLVLRSQSTWNDRNQYLYVNKSSVGKMGVFCEKSLP